MSEPSTISPPTAHNLEAAIGSCLSQSSSDKPLLLIGGDMSGIQPFLYQIVSSKAAKNLKGRSCYLDLLGKSVVESLLRGLHLSRDHVVCESGGTFVLLASNAPDVHSELEHLVRDIESHIFASHGISLTVAIGSVAITADEARGVTTTLADRWSELFGKREAKKNAKCASILMGNNGYSKLFVPCPNNGDRVDAITGEDIPGESVCVKDVGHVTRINKEIIDLGTQLRNGCTPVMLADDETSDSDFVIEPAQLGVKFRLVKSPISQAVQTFEKMCENEDGLERLGVLRMDVDDLGAKFQEYARTQSLEAYSQLSRELDNFFKTEVSKLCEDKDCYLLYGGGDDLFVVGQWTDVIALASTIRTAFTSWAKSRPGIWSLSAGVAIVKAKYPIIAGAKESGDEESNAKSHTCGDSSKNSISLLSMALNWDKEFAAVQSLERKLVKCLTDKAEPLPKSFLNKVIQHAFKARIACHKVRDVSIYWHLSYDIKRAIERVKSNAEIVSLLETCRKEICTPCNQIGGKAIVTDYHPLELWALACRWAELEYRNNE